MQALNVRFSIITPTCGRETLKRTLDSMVANGLSAEDEVIIVGDGPQPRAFEIAQQYQGRINYRYMQTEPDHCVGHPQRNLAMPYASGTHLLSIDDDDEYAKGALTLLRSVAAENPDKIIISRMVHRSEGLIWKTQRVVENNVGTALYTVPNIKERLGQWGRRYAGDYDFIRSTVDKWPGKDSSVYWHEAITIIYH